MVENLVEVIQILSRSISTDCNYVVFKKINLIWQHVVLPPYLPEY